MRTFWFGRVQNVADDLVHVVVAIPDSEDVFKILLVYGGVLFGGGFSLELDAEEALVGGQVLVEDGELDFVAVHVHGEFLLKLLLFLLLVLGQRLGGFEVIVDREGLLALLLGFEFFLALIFFADYAGAASPLLALLDLGLLVLSKDALLVVLEVAPIADDGAHLLGLDSTKTTYRLVAELLLAVNGTPLFLLANNLFLLGLRLLARALSALITGFRLLFFDLTFIILDFD